MKHIFLVNRFSLRDRVAEIIKKIDLYAQKEKLDYIIEVNDINNSTEDIIYKYRNDENIIYAIGGDGVINRVLNAIVGTKNILGFIPCGTGNDFYRTVKETLSPFFNEVDIIKINDRFFMNVACFGIDADIGNNEMFVHSKLIPKSQRYNVSVIKNFFNYKPRYFDIKINDNYFKGNLTTVCVCNGRYYGGGYAINPLGRLNNKKIDVFLINKVNKLKLANIILKIKSGKHLKSDSVKHFQTDNIIIKSDKDIRANIDGEILESKTFKIKMYSERIKIYYNQKAINEIG